MRHESLMVELGSPAPEFLLADADGKEFSLESFSSAPVLLVAFLCNHCPFVMHVLPAFVKFAAEYKARGVATVAISSNDVETYPEDSSEHMGLLAKKHNFSFPYLYDAEQQAAIDFQAVCTPDFFVYDEARRLVYRGRFDSSRPQTEHVQGNNILPGGSDLRRAVEAALANLAVPGEQYPSMGCSMKWKAGREPTWG